MNFFKELHYRNPVLSVFGWVNLVLVLAFALLSQIMQIEVAGVNAWFKPLKFALSIGVYSLSMAWFLDELESRREIRFLSWLITCMLGLELAYIAWQAGNGALSHFNLSTPFHAGMYTLMAAGATAVSLATLYTAFRFLRIPPGRLPPHYLWGVRLGLILFVIFSLQGFAMGARLSHSVGASDGGPGFPLLNWSRSHGDLRVAHFFGMHALQILPLLSWYVLRSSRWMFALAMIYAALAFFLFFQALSGIPFM